MTFFPPKIIKSVGVLAVAILSFSIISCKSKAIPKEDRDGIITFEDGKKKELSFNEDKSLQLEVISINSTELVKDFNYKVYEVTSKKILLEGVFRGTKLIWNTRNSLKGFLPVGIVQQETENPDDIQITNKTTFKIIEFNY